MNVLESILNFLTTLARIIFPRLQKPAAGDCPCPNPLPVPDSHPLPPDAGDGSDAELHRGDTVALQPTANTTTAYGGDAPDFNPLNVIGCCLMVAGGVGCVLKHLL